jgi:hypothetical protein
VLVVRRSFGIPDLVANEDAREVLVGSFEEQLRQNGWQSPSRVIAEPMVDALMALEPNGGLDDRLLPVDDAAFRLLDRGTTVVDSQHLVLDVTSEYPPEIVAVAQHVLDRVGHYVREQPFGG